MAHCSSDALVAVSVCGGLIMGGHHVPTKAAVIALLSCAGERKYNGKVVS